MSHIQILGVPGSGKSALAFSLAVKLGRGFFPEPSQKNPLIKRLWQGESVEYPCQIVQMQLEHESEVYAYLAGGVQSGGVTQSWMHTHRLYSKGKLIREEYESLFSLRKGMLPRKIYLKISAKTCLQRVKACASAPWESVFTMEYAESFVHAFDSVAEQHGLEIVDAEGSPKEVLQALENYLGHQHGF